MISKRNTEIKDWQEEECLPNIISVNNWSSEQSTSLVDQILAQIPARNSKFYREKIKWDQIDVDGMDRVELQDRLDVLLKIVPKFCNLKIILQQLMERNDHVAEAKSNGKQIKKEKVKKIVSKRAAPSSFTPFSLFYENEVKKQDDDDLNVKLLETSYDKLSDTEKLVWINKAVKKADKLNMKWQKILNSDEKRILNGEPKKPKSAFDLFQLDYCNTNDSVDTTLATREYSKLSQVKLKYYKMKENEELLKYKRDYSIHLLNLSKKKKTSFDDQSGDSDLENKQKSLHNIEHMISLNGDSSGRKSCMSPLKSIKKERKRTLSINEIEKAIEVSVSPKKKYKTEEICDTKKDEKIKEPVKLPESLFEYFRQHIYDGKSKKAKKSFEHMSKEELVELKGQYKFEKKKYVKELKVYLKSLPKEEMFAYAIRMRAAEEEISNKSDDSEISG